LCHIVPKDACVKDPAVAEIRGTTIEGHVPTPNLEPKGKEDAK